MSQRKVVQALQANGGGQQPPPTADAQPSNSSKKAQPAEKKQAQSELAKDIMTCPQLAPEFAYFVYQMVSPIKLPALNMEVESFREKSYQSEDGLKYSYTTGLDIEITGLNSQHPETKETLFINNKFGIALANNKTPGVASSLMIPNFLGTSFTAEDIQYDMTKKVFIFVNFAKVFHKMWDRLTAIDIEPYKPPFVPNLQSNNLAALHENILLTPSLLDSPEFISEKIFCFMRAIAFPFKLTEQLCHEQYGNEMFVNLRKSRMDFLCQSILDNDFRKFTFDWKKCRDQFIADLPSTSLKGQKIFQGQTEALTQEISLLFRKFESSEKFMAYLLEELNGCHNKYTRLRDLVDELGKHTHDPIAEQFLNQIIRSVGLESEVKEPAQHREIRTHLRKEILKDALINKIKRQNTLEGVFNIVKEIKSQAEFALLRNREGASLKAPGIKVNDDNITSVGARFAATLHAAKTRMYEIALANKDENTQFAKENNVYAIINNDEYWKFIITNINGYYFNLESLLEYVKVPATASKLLALKHAIENETYLSALKQDLTVGVMKGLAQIPMDAFETFLMTGSNIASELTSRAESLVTEGIPYLQSHLTNTGIGLQNLLESARTGLQELSGFAEDDSANRYRN